MSPSRLLSGIRAVTFDAGGTLLYPHPSVGAIYSEVIAAHGMSIDADALNIGFRRAWKLAHAIPRTSLSEETELNWWKGVVRETLNGLGEPKDFDVLFAALWKAFAAPSRWQLHLGACETLGALQDRGYRLAILSNWDNRLRSLIEGVGLASYFEFLVISSEIGVEKPDPRIFEHAQQKFGVKTAELLHIGDSHYHDMVGSTDVGWHCRLVTHGPSGADNHVSKLTEILELLPETCPN